MKNDIALIRVSKRIHFNDKINKIPLETEKFNNNYTSGNFSGWGMTNCYENSKVRHFGIKLLICKI